MLSALEAAGAYGSGLCRTHFHHCDVERPMPSFLPKPYFWQLVGDAQRLILQAEE